MSISNTFSPIKLSLIILAGFLAHSTAAHAAKSWGVTNEEKSEFSGTVVDITCQLTGNCASDCGGGKRQLGLKTADGKTILVAKNLTLYTGAAVELAGFCGQEIEVDGLFTENRKVRFFQVQNMRPVGEKKWRKATLFLNDWAEQYGGSPRKAKKWYRKDPRVKAIIERDGYLGLGLEQDAEYFKNR